jgi:hypothetical protein
MKMYHVFIISILLALNSCVTILQSLVTRDNIITDNRIDGVWLDSDPKNILVQKLMNSKFKEAFSKPKSSDRGNFTQQDSIFYSKLYVISYRENNLDYTWIAGLVKIKDQYYLNLKPEECFNSNREEVHISGETTSSIAKLTWKNENTLTLNFLNGNRIKEIILNGKAQIKYEYDPLFGTFVITASSRELEQFLEKYGDNETLVNGGNTIILTRKI